MYDKKRPVMGKWKRALIAAALSASVIMALPVWTVGRAQAAPDLEKGCTLVINRPQNSTKQGDVVVDLYKVADAVEMTGYDAYTLELPEGSPYQDIAKDLEDAQKQKGETADESGGNALYRALAQKTAKTALEVKESGENKVQAVSPTATVSLSAGDAKVSLEAGMYLVIAHGAGLSVEQYTTATGDDQNAQLVTMAYSEDGGYVYTYLPELISLPGRGDAPVGSFNTAGTAEWSYTITATLKSEEASRYTSLGINKTFMVPADGVVTGRDGCVYQVEAVLDGEPVYSNVVAINYEGRATGTVILEKAIPVGATVTITEVYDGAAFEISGDSEKTIDKAVPDGENGEINNKVFFTNNYNGTGTGGDVVTNSFTHSGTWEWNNPRPAPAAEGQN